MSNGVYQSAKTIFVVLHLLYSDSCGFLKPADSAYKARTPPRVQFAHCLGSTDLDLFGMVSEEVNICLAA